MIPARFSKPAAYLGAAVPLLMAAGCTSRPEIRLSKSLTADLDKRSPAVDEVVGDLFIGFPLNLKDGRLASARK
jgi:hypothetical protein